MRLRLKQSIALTWLTAVEALRQPIVLLLTLSCVVFVALLPGLIMHVMGEPDRLVRDSALAVQFVGGLLLAGYTACTAVKHEIQRGTVATVLTKPVGRTLFFLSKYAGVVVVLALFMVITTIATLMSTRMVRESYSVDWWTGLPLLAGILVAGLVAGLANYSSGRPATSTAFACLVVTMIAAFLGTSMLDHDGQRVAIGTDVPWKILPASILIGLALTVLAAIAVALATRLDTVPTLTLCSGVFLAGLMSDYLFGRIAAENRIAAVLYAVLPNWQHFWMTDALTGEAGIPWLYVGRTALYAAFYLAGVLCWGIVAFRRMELG